MAACITPILRARAAEKWSGSPTTTTTTKDTDGTSGARPLEIHQRETPRRITPTCVPSSIARHFSSPPGRIFSRVEAPPSTRSRYFYDASSRVPRSASSDSCTVVQLVSRSHFPSEFQPKKERRRRVYRGSTDKDETGIDRTEQRLKIFRQRTFCCSSLDFFSDSLRILLDSS